MIEKNWQTPVRPSDHAESSLVQAVLDGTFPVGSTLPGERQLALLLGVTRPTLRETLRRLERDGWFTVNQGKATVVNDFWHEGRLSVLDTLVRYPAHLPPNFVSSLLQVRADLAPTYLRQAVENDSDRILTLCREGQTLPDEAGAFALFDWRLHHTATLIATNPIYTLIINGFADLYRELAPLYFAADGARRRSLLFYAALGELAEQRAVNDVEAVVRKMMVESIALWPGRRNAT
jgi:GntR family negative regulator for fad regulon and positive regulator of fabA